jgi:hypothetical protein
MKVSLAPGSTIEDESENTAVVVGHMERGSGKTSLIAVHVIST